MTLSKNAAGVWEADCRDAPLPRIHLSLGTKRRADAEVLHAALVAFRREGDRTLDALLRQRGGGVTVQQLAACVRERRPFSTLLPQLAWPTVVEAVESYVAWLEGHAEREAGTALAARHRLRGWMAAFGEHRLDAIDPPAAEAWQARLASVYAINTVRVTVSRVVALYAWCAAREQRDARAAGREPRPLHCPLDPETRPSRIVRRERYLTREEATRLVAATPESFLAIVACGLLGGLRIEETLHLRPHVDVDFGRDMLTIQQRGEKGEPGYWRPKTGERREVPMTADLRPLLARHVERWGSPAYVFPSPSDPMLPDTGLRARRLFRPCVEAAGLLYGRTDPAGVVPHTLRHTFASWLIAADVNPYRVAKLLGNSLAMIETTYGHLAPTDNRAAVALLSGAVPFPTISEAA